IVCDGLPRVRIHQGARDWPAAAVFGAALAAGVGWRRRGGAVAAALGVAAIGVITVALGSTWFLDAYGDDLFLVPAPALHVRTLDAPPLAEFTTALAVSDLRVSPGGRSIAIATEGENEDTTFHVGRAGGALSPFGADQAAFVDDDRVLLMGREDSATLLRLISIGEPASVTWSYRLSDLSPSRLFVDRATGAWTVLGRNRDRRIGRGTGRLGADAARLQQWQAALRHRVVPQPIASTSARAVVLDAQYDHGLIEDRFTYRWSWMLPPTIRSIGRFQAVGDAATVEFPETRLEIDCPPLPFDEGPVCAAHDGARVGFFTMDAAPERLEAAGTLPGRYYSRGGASRNAIVGWWDRDAVVVRLRAREAIRIVGCAGECVTHAAADENIVAAVSG